MAGYSPTPPPYHGTPGSYSNGSISYNVADEVDGRPDLFDDQHEPEKEFAEAEGPLNESVLPSLATEEQMRQLEIIDKLQDLRIDSEKIDLPRLVVCGDQSSGKSSVLSAITGIPFPRQGGVCTKFVTQITLQHSPHDTWRKVSIEPVGASDRDRLQTFHAEIAPDFSNLPEIVETARQTIFTRSMESKDFADDILKIQVCGRDQQPLEILDLPGVINHDKRPENITYVSSMVKHHIQKSRSIILVVVGADIDLGRQTILQTIEQMPACRARCFGIITKPDVPKAENLKTYLNMASNTMPGYEFEWGWHVLRNSTPEELQAKETTDMRDAREREFFLNSDWQRIVFKKPYDSAQKCLGIIALRKRVRELVFRLNKEEIPNVRKDINRYLATCESRLKELGGDRSPAKIKERFRKGCRNLELLVQDFWRGIYDSRVPIGDHDDKNLLLRSRVVELSHEFTWSVQNFGHTYAPEHFTLVPESNMVTQGSRKALANFQQPQKMSQQQYYAEVHTFLNKTRGEELNTYFDPRRISDIFQKQSAKWPTISKHFLGEFYDRLEVFIEHALRLEFPNEEDVPGRLRAKFLDRNIEARKRKAEAELEQLLFDRRRPVKTFSIEFQMRTHHQRVIDTFARTMKVAREEEARRTNSQNEPGDSGPVLTPELVANDAGLFTASQQEEALAARFSDDALAYYLVSSVDISQSR
jgi:GTPase SAR1 family protein